MVRSQQSSWVCAVAFQRATVSVLQHQSSRVSTHHQSSLTTLQAPQQNYMLLPGHHSWKTVLHLQLTVQAPSHLPMLNQSKICLSRTYLFNAFQLQDKRITIRKPQFNKASVSVLPNQVRLPFTTFYLERQLTFEQTMTSC